MENISVQEISNGEISIGKAKILETNENLIAVSFYDSDRDNRTDMFLDRDSAIQLIIKVQSLLSTL